MEREGIGFQGRERKEGRMKEGRMKERRKEGREEGKRERKKRRKRSKEAKEAERTQLPLRASEPSTSQLGLHDFKCLF